MKKILSVICIIGLIVIFSGCESTEISSDAVQAKETEIALSEASREIGMPNVVNFQQRKMMKWIYELADKEDLVTYTYIKADYSGQLIFMGKSMGYGVPFSAQFTNPEKLVEADKQLGWDVAGMGPIDKLPQADPNGLFMPTSSSATWVIMVDPETSELRPIYFEPEIVVSPFPLSKSLGSSVVVGDESLWGKKAEK